MTEEAIALFQEVASLAPHARADYYARRGVSTDLREEVESLLLYDTGDASWSDDIAAVAEVVFETRTTLHPGSHCGPYRLIRTLGEGGMGSVFLAERADGEVEQLVAIKFIRPGADLPAIRDRFLRERSILASLQHPGIAHLLDAGRTEDGQPYLVMEYVDGTPIDVYAKELDVRQVLELFLPVCDAVSYAHRNLIVHRDLKPSNILIDASGRPRLLDFGIAKILDATEEARTVVHALTPEYASPEQARGEARSTATDIYSLGAVLRKLLRDKSNVPTDADFIVQKALRSEPEERYATADAFADDVRAFLEHRPVRARSGNVWYHARRFLRRYWIPCSATVLALSSLATGLYLANRERAVAQRRFAQVRELANKFIAIDKDVRDVPGTTQARNRIVSTSLEYLAALGAEAGGDKDLSLEIANAYVLVAHAQGIPVNSNLGQTAQAEESLRKANGFAEAVLKADRNDPRGVSLASIIAHDRMVLAGTLNRPIDALEQAHKAAALLDRLMALPNRGSNEIEQPAFMYSNIAVTFSENRRFEEAIRYARRAIELSGTAGSGGGDRSLSLGIIALSLRGLGDLRGALDAIQESRRIQEQLTRGSLEWENYNLALALQREGSILGEEGEINLDRPAEAEADFQRALHIMRDLANKDATDSSARFFVALIDQLLGNLIRHRDPVQGLALYDEGLAKLREIKNGDDSMRREEVGLLCGSSYALRALQRDSDAASRIESAFKILRDTRDYPAAKIIPASEADIALRASADQWAGTGRLDRAVELYSELLAKNKASDLDPHDDLRDALSFSHTYAALSGMLTRLHRTQEAASFATQRAELWRHWDQKLPNNSFVLRELAALRSN